MEKYNSYKDSGVQWIGKVPSHWNVCAFKRFMNINNGSDYKHIVSDEGFPVIGSGGPFATASQYMYDGEVVMLGRKGTIDKPMYFNGKFWAVDTMFYAVPLKEANCRFMYYLALTFPFNYYSTATALPSMTQTDLGNNPVAVPDLEEQMSIANYLDTKCSKIDNVIATQEKRVELLRELKQSIITRAVTCGINPNAKLKDSGVEWIGEIPEHWEVMKTSIVFPKIGSGTTPQATNPLYYTLEGDGYNWLQTGDLNDGVIDKTSKQITRLAVEACNMKFYPKDSIVIAMYGATIGKVGLLGIETSTNQACCVLPQSARMNSVFGAYVFLSAKQPLLLEAVGGGQPNISQDVIRRLKIPVPPVEEQKLIVTFIEQQINKLDSSITKALRQIELLKEYKLSLITEVVTGKRKVC